MLDPEISALIQHSAMVDSGNSGGPLLVGDNSAAAGYRVVGINTWKASTRESTNYSIPAAAIADFVEKHISAAAPQDVTERVDEFIAANGDEDYLFLTLTKYISNDMVGESGGDAFINVLGRAPSSVRSAVVELFDYNPVEGLRASLAYEIWKNFQGEDGVLAIAAGSPGKTSLGTELTLTPAGKETIDTRWIQEQGVWRLAEFSTIESSKLAEKEEEPESKYWSLDFKDPYMLNLAGGVGFAPGGKPSFVISAAFSGNSFFNYFSVGTFFDIETLTFAETNKAFFVGPLLRLRLPIKWGRLLFVPYAEGRFGFAMGGDPLEREAQSTLGVGGGLTFAYEINDYIAPMVGLAYQYSLFSGEERSEYGMGQKRTVKASGVVLSVGMKILGIWE